MPQATFYKMICLCAVAMATSLAMAQSSLPTAQNSSIPTTGQDSIPPPAVAPEAKNLPPIPTGKSTVIGGKIVRVDPVRDQITLKVFGGNETMKILFDERTQAYRNGQRIPILSLKPDNHASIETTLDGDRVFALRIHMLSELPEGECQGQIISYDPGPGILVLNASLSRQPIRLRVPNGTPVERVGQSSFAGGQRGMDDLARGTLVDVKFNPAGRNGEGVATHIDILATPGAAFTFSGNISLLDVHDGELTIVDPRDNQSYQFFFDAAQFPIARKLHEGAMVRVTANFDGSRYVASQITME
ncbi:MAG: hypothetical protein WA414_12025 [Acidobacteriaceae bacterium]